MAKKTKDHLAALELIKTLQARVHETSGLYDSLRKQASIVGQQFNDLTDEANELRGLLNTRAGRLLSQGVEFICVDAEEPYYMNVYRSIRQNAMARGRWSETCEKEFRARFDKWLDRVPVKERDAQRHTTLIDGGR